MFANAVLKTIFEKTSGHCHFCGDSLVLEKYAWKSTDDLKGAWEIDHIIQRSKGGRKDRENCLPACVRCNRLRWHRQGDNLRDLIELGLIAKDEMKKKTSEVGRLIQQLKLKRLETNRKRRRNFG